MKKLLIALATMVALVGPAHAYFPYPYSSYAGEYRCNRVEGIAFYPELRVSVLRDSSVNGTVWPEVVVFNFPKGEMQFPAALMQPQYKDSPLSFQMGVFGKERGQYALLLILKAEAPVYFIRSKYTCNKQ